MASTVTQVLCRGAARQVIASALILLAVSSMLLPVDTAEAAPTTITEFSAGLSGAPHDLVTGPDGALWFDVWAEAESAIGRITPSGEITEFSQGLSSTPVGLVAGPDGNLWFGQYSPPAIGRITPDGVITLFNGLRVNTRPRRFAVGPEGNIWFASTNGTRPGVGRVTPSGEISQFDLPGYPHWIVAGPDGNMWFTYGSEGAGAIGRIVSDDSGGITITLFRNGLDDQSAPGRLIAGADGNLWFVDPAIDAVGRVEPTGVITEFTDVVSIIPRDIAVGPDDSIWFTDWAGFGRIPLEGESTRFELPGHGFGRDPQDLAAGADGNLWFTAPGAPDAVGRITSTGSVTEFRTGLSANSNPQEIVVGSDASLWFSDIGEPSAIGQITPGEDVQALSPPISTGSLKAGPALPGRLSVNRRKIAVRANGITRLTALCKGGSHCAGKLTLTARVLMRRGRVPVDKVIAATMFSIPSGTPTVIKIRLNRQGRRLLRNDDAGGLIARLKAVGTELNLARSLRMSVRLVRSVVPR